MLWATAETGDGTLELFVAICQPAVEKVPELNPHGVANALGASAATSDGSLSPTRRCARRQWWQCTRSTR